MPNYVIHQVTTAVPFMQVIGMQTGKSAMCSFSRRLGVVSSCDFPAANEFAFAARFAFLLILHGWKEKIDSVGSLHWRSGFEVGH